MTKPPTDATTLSRARRLRRAATGPEAALWRILRGHRLGGLKFRRQHPIGPYIADFHCASAKLVIELDGMSHDDTADSDARRTKYMQQAGIRVVRILNDDVLADPDAVAEYILREALPPSPSGGRAGVGAVTLRTALHAD